MSHRLDRAIPKLLADDGPATGPELADRLDAHPATVLQRCQSLQREGRIRLVTGGKYATLPTEAVDAHRASD